MKKSTNQFSFVLRPSSIEGAGVGVFILHDVKEGTHLEVFRNGFEEVLYERDYVPVELQAYCLDQEGGKLICPKYFNALDIGNYLNHSKEPNLRYDEEKGYYAKRDISANEELFCDYRCLGEPEDEWDDYYTK